MATRALAHFSPPWVTRIRVVIARRRRWIWIILTLAGLLFAARAVSGSRGELLAKFVAVKPAGNTVAEVNGPTSAPISGSCSTAAPGGWSGRFSEPVSELVKRYTASVAFDQRLWRADIDGSLAHARMLAAQGAEIAAQIKKSTNSPQSSLNHECRATAGNPEPGTKQNPPRLPTFRLSDGSSAR